LALRLAKITEVWWKRRGPKQVGIEPTKWPLSFFTCLDTNKNRGLNQHIAITPTPMGLKTRNQSGSHQPFSGLKPDFTKKHEKIIHKATG
jgi:hypothetical protein